MIMHRLGDNNGFFQDMAKIYLFVRGQASFFTCIPKEKRTVHLRKDGRTLELPFMEVGSVNREETYRTDYTIYFDNPQESDAGQYTCYYGSAEIDYRVKVIGPPKIKCKHDDLIIRSPEENVFIECEVSSDFMILQRPTIIVNGTMERQKRIRDFDFEILGPSYDDKYTVKITGNRLDKYDSTVFRIEVKAEEMSKNEVLEKQGLSQESQMGEVLFNDFRVLPFDARREIILSVLSRVPEIIDPEDGCSVLVGTRDFEIKFTIFGSPVPTVKWYKNGQRVYQGDEYEMRKSNDLYFSLIIKKVTGSAVFKVEAQNSLSEGIPLTHLYTLTAHQPLVMRPHLSTEVFSVVNKPVNVTCAAKQKGKREQMNNAQTMDIVFTWFLDERQMMPTLSNNIRVTDSRDRDGYKESVMLFVPPRIDAYHVRCMAGLGRLDNLTHEIRLITGEAPEAPIDLQYEVSRQVFSWRSQRQDSFKVDVLEWAPLFAESDSRDSTAAFKVYNETTQKLPISADSYSRGLTSNSNFRQFVGSSGPFMKVELKKLTTPDKEFRPGVNYAFKVKTVNNYGPSEYSQWTYHRTADAVPTKMIESLIIQPDKEDKSKIFVSWAPFPRDQYNSYSSVGCCIKLVIGNNNGQKINLNCVDPRSRGVTTGWSGMPPYTQHRAEAWFANQQGEVQKRARTTGYNAAAEPNFYPEIIEDEDSKEPRQISVKFKAMAQEDINGPFLGYKLEIFDSETKNHISDKLDRDMGFSGEVKTLTVTGLLPYTDYEVVLSVLNREFSKGSPPWTQKTYAAKPDTISTVDLMIHQSPKGVHAFWLPPNRVNGEFERYETRLEPKSISESNYFQNTFEPQLDLTGYFMSDREHMLKLIGHTFEFVVATKNTLFIGDETSKMFTLQNAEKLPPDTPRPPEVDCQSPAFNLTVSWNFKHFGQYASTHYIKYRYAGASDSNSNNHNTNNAKFELMCKYISIGDFDQECVIPVRVQAASYDIHLVARNENGESVSEAVHCTTVAPYTVIAAKQTEGIVRAANVPLFFAFLALILLMVVAVLGIIYWRKNRSHPYRVREQEMKFRPKDAPSFPRKDDTARFDEYHPDLFGKHPMWDTNPRIPLMPSYTPRPSGSRIDLDADSYDDDEDMLGGFDEDGSFLEAYGRGAMDPPTELNTSV
ncbi:uncharacterized protein LOC134855557 isoform X2 [Symsagittifera roscoffensis]|uniref:uncharacterized protein LOC134855557 isoform X2 n=1 Tax=Symsagittifera roscoffensis TaxID=84072 RepID=UPI00307B56C0